MELPVFFVEMNHDGMIVQGVRDVLEGGVDLMAVVVCLLHRDENELESTAEHRAV